MNIFNIARAFNDKKRRDWEKLYVCVDVHDVILEGKYNLMNEGASFMPNAIRVLQNWSKRKDMTLIMWTSSHDAPVKQLLMWMEASGIHFDYVNENPECQNTELCNFSKKLYFNILLDDKAGFDGKTDWFYIEDELKRIGEWRE